MGERAPRTGRKLLPRTERAASIRRAAARAFARSGYAATSIDDIAGEAGVTKIILYRHYDTKKDIYQAVLDEIAANLAIAGRPEYLNEESIRLLVGQARRDPHGFTLVFRHAAREPEFAGHAAAFTERALSYLDRGLAGTVSDPRLRRWTSHLVFDLTIGGILSWLETGTVERDEEAVTLLHRSVEAVTRSLATGKQERR